MSGPPLTREQRRAVERGRGDACVVAGAGSGKTTVLTARARRLVEHDGVDLRRVAALTFTDAAAAEMRSRLARAFGSDEAPGSASRRRDVAFAPISTIHAYGARLLREHAIEAGVDPAFRVLDEDVSKHLLEDAWARVDARRRAASDPALSVVDRLGGREAVDDLLAAFERIRALGREPGSARWSPGPATLAQALEGLRAARAGVEALARAAGAAGQPTLVALARLAGPGDLGAPTFACVRRALDGDGTGRMDATLPKPPGGKGAIEVRKALFEAYAGVAGALLDAIGAAEVEGPVRALWDDLDREYARGKREAGGLDYADLERLSVALLERLAAEGRSLEEPPERLLVDEFQDVNPLQARLLAALRAPAGRARVDLFAVGDPKQAIYGFRGSDETVMRAEGERVGTAGRQSLTESFRSRPELVAFHNAVFSERITAASVGVDYEPMTAAAAFHAGPGVLEPAPPELLLVDAGEDGDRLRLEAEAVARRVGRWLSGEDGLRAKKERDAAGAWLPSPRPFRPRDVAILLRTWGPVKAFERALLAAGIPFHVGRGRGFYGTEELSDLVHLLRVVNDPRDDFAVAAWMTSPAVGATDEDVLAAFRGATAGTAFSRAAALPRVAAAAARVQALRTVAARSDLATVVRQALDAADSVPTALLQDGGARRAGNLEKAVAVARRVDAEGRHGLSDLLRWLSDVRERGVEEPEAPAGTEGDSVALLTVHAAKGLEWPCVVLACAHASTRSTSDRVLVASDGRFAARLADPLEGDELRSGGHAALGDARRQAEAREAERLLYVALTRAEERLVVSMSCKGETTKGEPAYLRGWGKSLWDRLEAPFEPGEHAVDVGGSRLLVRVERPEPEPAGGRGRPFALAGAEGILSGGSGVPAVDRALLEEARGHWARVRRPVETLGRTPFVATVSDLLAFAASPQDYYRERVLGAVPAAAPVLPREVDDPESGDGSAGDGAERGLPAIDRDDAWDGRVDGLDRAALGRVVHRAIERWAGEPDLAPHVDEALEEEHGGDVPAGAREAALAMAAQFAASGAGREVARALAAGGGGVRREVAFHARIAFPEKEPVDGYDSLLVKGSIDLWLPRAGGAWILDHKTNSPRGAHATVEALREHYAPQLRLYALAVERILSQRVAGASLLLLDPAWAAAGAPLEVEVDVSDARLGEARRLCRAFALSMRHDRYPPRWQDAASG